MTFPIFPSFRSTANPAIAGGQIFPRLRLLVDAVTGAPTGILNPNDGGADGVWTPVNVTAAQVASPPAAMLADLNAVYRLNVAPYTRYYSTGTMLAEFATNQFGPDGVFGNMIVYSPFTVSDPAGVAIAGTIHVIAFPA